MKAKWMACVLAAYAPLALAQEVVIFGDSLSDVGQKGWADHTDPDYLHMKSSYLKADGSENLLYGEHVAQALGGNPKAAFPLDANAAAGTNYAHSGGVVVGSNSPKNMPVNDRVAIHKQIDAYLASGKVNPNHLHILWGGGNDMAAILEDAAAITDPAQAQGLVLQRTAEAAATSGAQWQRLQAAGVDLVVAPDVPNVLYTPQFMDSFAFKFAEITNKTIQASGATGSSLVGNGAQQTIQNSYLKHMKEASASEQHNLADFNQVRAEILDKVVEDLWAAPPPLLVRIFSNYKTYGEIFTNNNVTKESIREQLTQNYGTLVAASTQATNLLNAQTTQALNQQGGNVVRLAVSQLFTDMLSDPAKYGFSNTLGRACNQATAKVLCGEELRGRGKQAAHPDADNLLFADSFHPGPKAHKIMADYLLSTLQAPVDMGGLRRLGVQSGEAAADFVREDSNRQRQQRQSRTLDAVAAYRHDEGGEGGHALYAGAKVQFSDAWQLGVVLSRQEQKHRFGDARIRGKTHSLTTTLRHDAPQWWLGGMLQINDSDYDTRRHIRLGQAQLVQTGQTGGSSMGAGMFGGYEWALGGQTRLAALGDLTVLKGKIKGFGERDGGATQMQFGQQNYTALRSGVGVQLSHRLGAWQPYANTRWVKDWKNKADMVEAGMNGSRFSLAVPRGDRSWLNAQLGVQWQPQASPWRAFAQVGRDFGREGSAAAVQLGVGARF